MAVAKQLKAARVEPEVTELVNGTGHGSRQDLLRGGAYR